MVEPAKSFDEALETLASEIQEIKQDPLKFKLSATSNTASVQGFISNLQTTADYENARVKLFGKNGVVTSGFADLGRLAPEVRPAIGNQRKELVTALERESSATQKRLDDAALNAKLNTEGV